MLDTQKTSVAHILLGPCSDMNFAHVVGEMQRTLTDCMETPYTLEWKEDDVAIFDMETTRVVFAVDTYTEQDEMSNHYTCCLMVSVGPALSGKATLLPTAPFDRLCQLIVRRISAYYGVAEVVWRETDAEMNAETIELLLGDLPVPATPETEKAVPQEEARLYTQDDVIQFRKSRNISFEAAEEAEVQNVGQRRKEAVNRRKTEALSEYQDLYQTVANSVPELTAVDAAKLYAIRAALYAPDQPVNGVQLASPQTRLAATAMDVTMVMVCLPVGAAMLTYHVLKGGELRRSAQMLTLTGLFMSGANSAVAQQVLAYF